ncbi:hypothetical protein OGM84_11820 [Pediococcus acidilactici]
MKQLKLYFVRHGQTILYIVDDTIREHLPEEPAIRTTLAAARRMDFLFCGLGTISSFNSISTWKSAKNKILPYVNAEDIAGMLYARPYDINGNFLTQTNDNLKSSSLRLTKLGTNCLTRN